MSKITDHGDGYTVLYEDFPVLARVRFPNPATSLPIVCRQPAGGSLDQKQLRCWVYFPQSGGPLSGQNDKPEFLVFLGQARGSC